MSSSNCCFLTCIHISQEAGQVVWYSHLFQNFPQFIVIHTVKGFGIVNKAEIDVFLEPMCLIPSSPKQTSQDLNDLLGFAAEIMESLAWPVWEHISMIVFFSVRNICPSLLSNRSWYQLLQWADLKLIANFISKSYPSLPFEKRATPRQYLAICIWLSSSYSSCNYLPNSSSSTGNKAEDHSLPSWPCSFVNTSLLSPMNFIQIPLVSPQGPHLSSSQKPDS